MEGRGAFPIRVKKVNKAVLSHCIALPGHPHPLCLTLASPSPPFLPAQASMAGAEAEPDATQRRQQALFLRQLKANLEDQVREGQPRRGTGRQALGAFLGGGNV